MLYFQNTSSTPLSVEESIAAGDVSAWILVLGVLAVVGLVVWVIVRISKKKN